MLLRIFALSLFLFSYPLSISAQSESLNEIIEAIDFEEDTVKAVFVWVANNVKYDLDKLKQMDDRDKAGKHNDEEFLTEESYREQLLETVIKKRKGVCYDFAILFDALVAALGYESYIVTGYTKTAEGKLNRGSGHAWNAVKVGESWHLYDPTWGAGYVRGGKKFVPNLNMNWYDVAPTEMIKDHMPLDPIWQLSKHPVNYHYFETGEPTDSFHMKTRF